jgi:hypothetical protein
LSGRVWVFDRPWGEFTLDADEWRERLADVVAAHKIDVLIAGPLSRIGMHDAGTLQDVVAFMGLIVDLRRLCGRPLADVLLHHENKSGAVSGAWEGSGDTLLHVESAGNGHTVLHVEKARWAPAWHRKTLKLAWAEGEGFEVEGERDLLAEVEAFLAAHPLRTVTEISASEEADPPGIGANRNTIKSLLEGNPERFDFVTGDDATALGRSPRAILWNLLGRSEQVGQVEQVTSSPGGATQGTCSLAHPVGGASDPGHTPVSASKGDRRTCSDTCSGSEAALGGRPGSSIDYAVLGGDVNHGREAGRENER